MARFTFAEYEAAQERRNSAKDSTPRTSVSYFALKNDGDEAIVRFIYSSPEDFDLVAFHQVKVGDRFKRVSCLRTPKEPVTKCPFCGSTDESVAKVYSKFFVKLIEYVRDESGKIVAMPRVWERPVSFARTLATYFTEYGDISDCIFKVKRHGAPGSTDTSYDVIFGNPAIYKPDTYVKDFSAFETYSLNPYVVADKTFEDMNIFLLQGEFPETVEEKVVAETTPTMTTIPGVIESAPTAPAAAVRAESTQTTTSPASSERPVRRYTF